VIPRLTTRISSDPPQLIIEPPVSVYILPSRTVAPSQVLRLSLSRRLMFVICIHFHEWLCKDTFSPTAPIPFSPCSAHLWTLSPRNKNRLWINSRFCQPPRHPFWVNLWFFAYNWENSVPNYCFLKCSSSSLKHWVFTFVYQLVRDLQVVKSSLI
jgi:hypothetical protein